ncbi:head-tail connector protein [Terrisporobacter sp.]|uniref:head-tail connector protein n=1 Tax=Terrisporobacter sp. TaxID=1965305 RepID=UPI00289D4B86|nr:head-tail connector protein [Terrisporobacter sp.]
MIEEIKQYSRVEDIDEDTNESALLQTLEISAKMYLKNAGVITPTETNEFYNLAVKILVTHWYDNREPIGKADKLAYSLDSIIAQLKYCEV